jgi:S-adenosylmethionine-diacylglycerol 3-amino-3-carboxypropyl transferase
MKAGQSSLAPSAGGRSAIAAALDLNVLRYSRVWEDHRLLQAGLRLDADSRLLSICGAGCNVLTLLLEEPTAITAVDFSPVQAALLDLQITAIRRLPAPSVRRLLGVVPAAPSSRVAEYAELRRELAPSTRSIWDHRTELIARGLAFSGRLERYILEFTTGPMREHVPEHALRALFRLDRDAAREAWAERWLDRPGVEAAFREWFARDRMAARGRDAAQFRWVEEIDVTEELWHRFRRACVVLPTRDNFYLHAFLFGSYGEVLPPYLSDDGQARLQPLLDRIDVHVADLSQLLAGRPAGTFSHAALSDVFEYQSPQEARGVMKILGERLQRGGRVAFWNFLVDRAPGWGGEALIRLDGLSDELWRQDRSWFYRSFHVAEVTR